MDNKENVKINHHFVFQRYLQEWVNAEDNSLWVLREKKKIFSTGTSGIAFRKSFYTIKELNKEEIQLLHYFIATLHPLAQEEMKSFIYMYLLPFENEKIYMSLKRDAIKAFGTENNIPLDVKKDLDGVEHIIKLQKNNTLEDYYCEIEGELTKCIEYIKIDGIDFYYKMNDKERFDFLYNICNQYFRTATLKNKWVNRFGKFLNSVDANVLEIDISKINLNNVAFFYFWIIQCAVTSALMHVKCSVVLLNNNTKIPFITADQPIINLKSNNETEKISELEFYYPITPRKALLINGKQTKREVELKEDDVIIYNKAIAEMSQEFLISNDKEILEQYMQR